MATDRLEIAEEVTARRTFVWAIDWPGWCRAGKDRELAITSFLDHAPRFGLVPTTAGQRIPTDGADHHEVVETVEGGSSTEFGVPSAITALDRRPAPSADAERLASLVEAAWTVFDEVAATSPAVLRKGPRGGGRDRDKMIGHVIEADHAYAREIGVRLPSPSIDDRRALDAERAAVLEVLRRASDGSPLAGRTWTPRYAARRIAWHALDHAWEMEDRSEPA
jgi:hypothetical protein